MRKSFLNKFCKDDFISIEANKVLIQIEISNVLGHIVLTQNMNSKSVRIDASKLLKMGSNIKF